METRLARFTLPMALLATTAAAQAPLPVKPFMLPAVGPTCESVELPSPDNSCVVHYIQTRGEGINAQTRGEISCSSNAGGFFMQEFVRLFSADMPLAMRWIDPSTLEVGLPRDATFSPPLQSVVHPGHTIKFVYRVMSREEMGPVQCFTKSAEDFRSFRQLSGPTGPRPAHEPRWTAYGSDQRCILGGQSATGQAGLETIGYSFTKAATAQLPYGTSELVLLVSVWKGEREARVVAPSGEELPMQANGPGKGFRLVGAGAERVLKALTDGGKVEVSLNEGQPNALRFAMTHERFAEAYAAFEKCRSALAPAAK